MRDSVGSMSSSASTSGTIIKRSGGPSPSPVTVTSSGVSSGHSPSSGDEKTSNKCDCCPYGIHIDLGFVTYAQNVSNGFVSRQGTPTNPRGPNGERQLTSPLDNSIFSDSLDNLMSDFDDVMMAPQHKDFDNNKKFHNMQDIRNRMQNGYNSDYTTYRRELNGNNGNGTAQTRGRAHFEPVKPTPINRPINLGFTTNSRSNTPTMNTRFGSNGTNSGYSTALAKTVSEIRARNAESPFPDSRVGTPIDLGLSQNGTNGFYPPPPSTPSRFHSRLEDLPPTPTPTFRRAPSQGDLPRNYSSFSTTTTPSNEFASLRRGREKALPPDEHRVRFFSASPKLPRRLQAGPSIDVESHFTYSQTQNGQRVLARTQSTCTSPPPSAFEPVVTTKAPPPPPPPKPKPVRSIAVSTGPLPAPKPCGECAALRKELFRAVEKIPGPPPPKSHVSTATVILEVEEKGVGSDPVEFFHIGVETEKKDLEDVGTFMEQVELVTVDCQTDKMEEVEVEMVDTASSPIPFEVEDKEVQSSEITVIPKTSEVVEECSECLKRKDVFTRNVGVGACSVSDKICVNCDKQVDEADENEAPGFKVDPNDDQKQRNFEIAKANAVKKLLTNEQKSNFQRGTAVSKSARYDRKKSVDDLDYIVDKKKGTTLTVSAEVTVPENSEALKSKILLKKEIIIAEGPSKVPEPIPARIPRPKFSRFATPEEAAETPDEEEEAQDRLTPLRSELRSMGNRWVRNQTSSQSLPTPPQPQPQGNQEDVSDSDAESDCSAASDGTFEVNDDVFDAAPFEVSDRLREALENFNSSILEPNSVPEETVEWSAKLVRHEWMKTAGRRQSRYEHVDKFIEELKNLGSTILNVVINLADMNGNTALHYAVSHANFPVVSSILDSGECDLNTPNRAGYTAVMLAALSQLEDEMEKAVVHRLFQMGNVNAKASQHGQTALMLAVSHGKKITTELLLSCGADVNEQDEEGSTALMCAAEHGHRDIVKMLLADSQCNASLTDCDNSTALSIALENDHREIGVMIYAYLNYGRLDISGPTSTI